MLNKKVFFLIMLICVISIFWPMKICVSQTTGFIVIKSNPSGAEVFINGKTTGKTTMFQMPLEAGDYKFTLHYDKYHNFEGEFTIQKNQTVTKDVALKPAYGSISVTSEPSGAKISLDGIELNDTTSVTLKNISSGQHILRVSKNTYSDKIDTVIVKDELTSDVFVGLLADFGTIKITTRPNAKISIDGNMVVSGTYVGKLQPGKHKVEVTRENYYPEQREIIVNKGQGETLDIQLKPIVGALTIMVDPPETEIYLNSKYFGLSPITIDTLFIGEYNLELRKEGFGTFRQHLLIKENKIIKIDTTMLRGKLITVKSIPDSAEVYCNGSIVGTTPLEFIAGDGSNKLILKKKFYIDKEEYINAERNDQDFSFKLETDATNVTVNIETRPNKAIIHLVEKAFLSKGSSDSTKFLLNYNGVSPYQFQIPIGKWDVKVEKKGFKSIEKKILVEKQDNYSFNLEPIKYRTKWNGMLLSVLWPGAGQAYIKRGSASVLMGFVGYGFIASGIYEYQEATKNYDKYLKSDDTKGRASDEKAWKNNLNLYHYSEYACAAVWGINFIWTIAMKSEKKRYKNVQFSFLNTTTGSIPTFGWRSEF